MSLNPNFNLLKKFFGDRKKTEQKMEIVMRDVPPKKVAEKIQREKGLKINETLRSEFHFLKFPFFDLCPRLSKKDKIEIREVEETEEGKIEIYWKVSRNVESNFPSSFARKLHKEVIEKTLNSFKKPIPYLIRLGSLRQICREMNMAISGKNMKEIKKALINIKTTTIEVKGTFRQKEKNGTKKFVEGVFNLYSMVFFAGETLPDGTKADEVYVLLNEMYVQNFNNNFVVPMDYHYFQSLKGDIASRMYEVLSVWFYPALENGKEYIQKEYLELCNYFPLTRQNAKWKARGQLKSAHQQHLANGFLDSEPEWLNINQSKDNWLIRYWIGPNAKDWHKQNKRLKKGDDIDEDIKKIEEPKRVREEKRGEASRQAKEVKPVEKVKHKKENPLVSKLTSAGVTKKVAENLVENSNPKAIEDWIEAIHDTKADDKPAFLVRAIQENWALPEIYKKKQEKKKQEVEEQARRAKQEEQSKIRVQYEKYRKAEIDAYLKKLPPEQYQQELERTKKEFQEKYPIARQWGEDSQVLKSTIEAVYLDEIKNQIDFTSFEEWIKIQKSEEKKKS